MKVVCIKSKTLVPDLGIGSDKEYKPLTVGHVYDAEELLLDGDIPYAKDYTETYYNIDGYWERKTDFMTINEYREKQLESIGI